MLIREADLAFGPGLNAITGETGAGKTIFAQAIGLLLGARADASSVGADGAEAYVEAELDVPEGFFDEDDVAALAELRPEGEPGLVLARRVFADGRTRAYAWGRAVAREDVAAAAERLLAMSGQFEQRRLARAAFQLDLLDAFCGDEQLERRREAAVAWRELGAARRLHEELTRDASQAAARLAELEALVEDTRGLEPGDEESLRARRERLRHVAELEEAAAEAAEAVAPEEGEGAASLAARAERALAPLERIAPELGAAAEELRDSPSACARSAATCTRSSRRSRPTPARSTRSRAGSRTSQTSSAGSAARRSRSCWRARATLGASSTRPRRASTRSRRRRRLSQPRRHVRERSREELRAVRRANARPFAEAVADELRGLGMGDGEFLAELREREPGPSGADEVAFLIRPNAGLPFGPVAETASGGELSRVALALAAVAGGETLVFDEIDAGIGGVTAHAVASTLQRLAERAQVLTITHLPQIASVADRHLRVEKVPGDPTHTRIEELDDVLRREELERMAGGAEFLDLADR